MKRLFIIIMATIMGLSLVGASVALASEAPPQFALEITSSFSWPSGVAVDSSGNIYVVDKKTTRPHRIIQKFGVDGNLAWGNLGTGNGQFLYPSDLAVDSSGNVYVADTNNDRIQKFDSVGIFKTKWGSYGTGNGQFNSPGDVAVDSSGNVYVADTGNNRIQKFDSDGNFLAVWGSFGQGDGQFDYPVGVAVDSSGNVYVADTNNDRIQKFDSDGIFKTEWGESGTEDGQFDSPNDVTVDSSGNVYVADTDNDRIQKFDVDGNFMVAWGSFGQGVGQFYEPSGVTTDLSGNVYVADTRNRRIQIFTQVISDSDGDGYSDDEEIEYRSDPYNNLDIPEVLAGDQLVEMIQQFDLQAGLEKSLGNKLHNVIDVLTASNNVQRQDAVNKLQAFINSCEAQKNKALTPEQAEALITEANAIITSLQMP